MTFDEIVTEVKERLDLTSTEATARIGRLTNDKYKEITADVGLATTRRTTVSTLAVAGTSTLIFTGIEKIINVVDRTSTKHKVLDEVTMEELREEATFPTSNKPRRFAVQSTTATTVTILMDVVPSGAAFTLYADGYANMSTLSGTNVPVFAESYHNVIIWAVLGDEYRRLMRMDLARDADEKYKDRLGKLRLFIASKAYLDLYQNKDAKNKSLKLYEYRS